MLVPNRLTRDSAELRTIQVIEGDERMVSDVVAALRQTGCVMESVVRLGAGKWKVTARSAD